MIPLGVLASSYAAPAGGGGPLTLTWRGSAAAASISNVAIGDASSTRSVIVVSTRYGTIGNVTCTINGVSASLDFEHDTNLNRGVSIFRLAVPTGTTADVVVSYIGGYMNVGVWTIEGSCAVLDTGEGGDSTTVDTSSDGVVVCGSAGEYSGSATWTNATERFDYDYGTGADVVEPTGSPMTISATNWKMRIAAVSYAPD